MKKTIFLTTVALLLLTVSCGQRQSKSGVSQQEDAKTDILTWTQMRVDVFGCMMEKTFGYRHERFNCSLRNYVNNGDPCFNTGEYNEGPQFPENLTEKVHPWMKEIFLNWEGGVLQTVVFLFDKPRSEEQILKEFGIDPDNLPDNIFEVSAYERSLTIIGFEHFGAGEIDCGDVDMYGESNPAPPPPGIVVGTWKAPAKRGHVAYLEIFVDGMAGLYLGDANSDELYEIYRGTVCPADDVDMDGDDVDYLIDMNFDLDWYIYESDDGAPVNVPASRKGTYVLRHSREGSKRMLYVKAVEDADPLFDKKEMKMERVQKTLQNGNSMSDVENDN